MTSCLRGNKETNKQPQLWLPKRSLQHESSNWKWINIVLESHRVAPIAISERHLLNGQGLKLFIWSFTLSGVRGQEVHIPVIPGQLLMVWLKGQELGRDRIRKLAIRSLGKKLEMGSKSCCEQKRHGIPPFSPCLPYWTKAVDEAGWGAVNADTLRALGRNW